MSDVSPLLQQIGITERDLILALMGSTFICDYGVVSAVNGNIVEVEHAVVPQTGEVTVTKGVELLWPYPVRWDVQAGDGVLLVGLKDFVQTVSGVQPESTDVPLHYAQATMKAVPFGAYSAGTRNVYLNGNTKSLVTWDELNTALQAHVHSGVSTGGGTSGPPAGLDISAAKTTTVKTGG